MENENERFIRDSLGIEGLPDDSCQYENESGSLEGKITFPRRSFGRRFAESTLAFILLGGTAILATISLKCNPNKRTGDFFLFAPREYYTEVDLKKFLLNSPDFEDCLLRVEGQIKFPPIYSYNKSADWKDWGGVGDTRMIPNRLSIVLEEPELPSFQKINGRLVSNYLNSTFCYYNKREVFEEVHKRLDGRVRKAMESDNITMPKVVIYGHFNGKVLFSQIIGFNDGSGYEEFELSNIPPGYYGSTEELRRMEIERIIKK